MDKLIWDMIMNYTSLLKEYDLKATPQRLEILDLLYVNGHMNIDDMYSSLKEKFSSLSLSTVYKNIHLMCQKVLLLEVRIPNTKDVYELTKAEHHHIVCSKCNHINDIKLDTSGIYNQAKSISDYTLDKTSIVIKGICSKCRD